MPRKQKKIFAIGAFDRFNYGDLLFPIIVKNVFHDLCPDSQVSVHALSTSDFSQFGALKTAPIGDIYAGKDLQENDVILFAGGGTIGVNWCSMHANLLGKKGNLAIYYLQRILGDKWANHLSRMYLKAQSPFPWVASPSDFPVPVQVIYNAVGGSEFSNLSPEIQHTTLQKLSEATYLSVRDAETKNLLSPIEKDSPVHLSPDSAILMSEQYPIEELAKKISPEVRALTEQKRYICFQSNIGYAQEYGKQIVHALEQVYSDHGLQALLLPIGRYVGLEDQSALANIKKAMKTPVASVSDQSSIWDIMYVIAQSSLFLGTSLHGNITAQSFATPHLGLSEKKCKVDYYLDSWDIPEQAHCVQLREVSTKVAEALAVPNKVLIKKRIELIELAMSNFKKIAKAAGLLDN